MTNARTNTLIILLSATVAGLACSGGGSVDIGSTQAIGSQLSDYAATWDGFAEAFHFWPDGSDRVRLTIDTSGQGTLEIGDAAPLPPPTDPNVGYPSTSGTGTGTQTVLVEGFLYPIHAASVTNNRIQLGVDSYDLYAAWCQLQTSYAWNDPNAFPLITGLPGYNCVPQPVMEHYDPNYGCSENLPDGTTVPVDCLKWDLCFMSMVCDCTSTGCTGKTDPPGTPVSQYIELDGTLDSTGSTLTATLALGPTTVVLTRQ